MQLVTMKLCRKRTGPQFKKNAVLIKRGNLETDLHTERLSCEDEGSHPTSQGGRPGPGSPL
jgi:hypothetical protein